MNKVMVVLIYFSFAVLAAVVFALMLVLITVGVIGVPSGVMLAVFGLAIKLFNADFIITGLSPMLMIFGGAAAACLCAFFGLLGIKAGFLLARVFSAAKRRCDRLRGW